MENQQLVTIADNHDLMRTARRPMDVLREARECAVAIQDVINQSVRKPVKFNNQQYLELEHWQMIAHFYGLSSEVEWTRFVDYGSARGFESRARIIHNVSGRIVATSEAMCLNDEERWSGRPKYVKTWYLKNGTTTDVEPDTKDMEWIPNPKNPSKNIPRTDRVQVGIEPVPLSQIRSMAQTRACAKGYRLALAWVAVLAGYAPTPAEELTGNEREIVDQTTGEIRETEAEKTPPRKSESADAKPAEGGERVTVYIEKIENRDSTSNGRAYLKRIVHGDNGQRYSIYKNAGFVTTAIEAQSAGKPVSIGYTVGRFGNDVVSIAEAGDGEAGDGQ